MKRGKLRSVPSSEPVDVAKDIYAAGREKREDREHWAKVHIEADRRNVPRRWWRIT